MTQELFQKAVSGVIDQGRLSRKNIAGSPCYYRHPDDPNIRCAVGHLISDETYDSNFEGICADSLINDKSLDLPEWSEPLQRCHDSAENLDDFIQRATHLAKHLGYTMP